MKRLLFITILLFITLISNAQDLSYGLVLGANTHKVNAKDPLFGTGSYSYFNIGGFFDYGLNDKFGIRSQLIYNKAKEDFYSDITAKEFDTYVSSIHFSPSFKMHVGGEYNTGFYFLSGPRISFVLNSELDNGDELEGFYKNINFGFQFGFGVVVLEYFGIEIVGDFDISNNDVFNFYS